MPEPLSLMPGPCTTESRCAPTTTVRSGSPPAVSARMFSVWRGSDIVDVTTCSVAVRHRGDERLADRAASPITGMVWPTLPSVPLSGAGVLL